MTPTVTPTLCRICLRSCGILVHQTGKDIKITGNPEHPISKGFICFRGANYHHVWGSENRLTQPLLRKGKNWQWLSYEDALGLLAEKISQTGQKYGMESVAFLKGESLKHQEISLYMKHFAHSLGTPNYLTIGSMCQRANFMGHDLTYGGIPKLDYEHHQSAVLWGRNIAVASVATFKGLQQAVSDGLKLLVIDPSITKTAEIADVHLRITPGTDGLLALAFIKVATESYGLIPDPEHQVGWETLHNHINDLVLNGLLKKCGITLNDFDRASRLIFKNLPTCNLTGLGLELQPSGVQSIRAVACLHSLVDPERLPTSMAIQLNTLPKEDAYPKMADPIGSSENPLFYARGGEGQAMYLNQAVLEEKPYPVKLLFVAGANPALTFPATSAHIEMCKKLEFLVVSDLFMTATAL